MKFKLDESNFKSGDSYYGGLPSEPSASEYGKMIDAAKTSQQAILDKYNIEVEKIPNHIIYTGSVNGHDITLIESVDGFNHWVNTLIIDNNEVDIYNSPACPGSISEMFEVNKSGILAVIDFIEKDALDQLVFKNEPLTEASNTTVYRAEYYEPKLDKWVSYYENNSLDSVKSNLDNPIVGDPRKRIAQYERSGIRKPSYKFVKEVDATLTEWYPNDEEEIELEYKDIDLDDTIIDWTYEVDKDDLYTFIFESCITKEDYPRSFEDDFDSNNEEDWKEFSDWLDDNFDEIFSKYEDKIMDNYEEEAVDDALENYDPDDFIDWDSMPGGHDDYRFDESIKGDNMKFKVMNEAVEEKICCICKQPYEGYGNNAEPVCSGTCCDKCNIETVLKKRIEMMSDNKNLKNSKIDEASETTTVLTFKPTPDFEGIDLTNTLCDCLLKANINYQDAKKRAGNYIVTILGDDSILHRAKITVENCGFFKEWVTNESLNEALTDYKITYYLATATKERRPETREDIDNDYKEIHVDANDDFDALSKAFMIQRQIDDSDLTFELDEYDIKNEEDFVKYFNDTDWGDGSILMLKVEGPNGVLYDTGYNKQTFIDELEDNIAQDKAILADMEKEDPEMAARFREILGITESVEPDCADCEESEEVVEDIDDDYSFEDMITEEKEINRFRHMYGVED